MALRYISTIFTRFSLAADKMILNKYEVIKNESANFQWDSKKLNKNVCSNMMNNVCSLDRDGWAQDPGLCQAVILITEMQLEKIAKQRKGRASEIAETKILDRRNAARSGSIIEPKSGYTIYGGGYETIYTIPTDSMNDPRIKTILKAICDYKITQSQKNIEIKQHRLNLAA